MTPIHKIIPVWGSAYTRCLIEIGLPALLAPGNLPALGRHEGNLCHIVTTADDRAAIECASVFRPLADVIDVRFETIDSVCKVSEDRHAWQSYCYRIGMAAANERGAAMVFLNPDVVVADGGLNSLVMLLHRGKRAVQVLGIRLVKETVVPALISQFTSKDRTQLIITPRQLIALAMAHLHPLTKMHLYDAPECDLVPSALFWRVGLEGMVARCFHLHPMLVHPRVSNAAFSTTIDDDYLRAACPSPDDEHVVVDSDEFCACELSGLERGSKGLSRMEPDNDVAQWAWAAAKPHHFENFVRHIVLRGDLNDEVKWREVCAQADGAVGRILQGVLARACG